MSTFHLSQDQEYVSNTCYDQTLVYDERIRDPKIEIRRGRV